MQKLSFITLLLCSAIAQAAPLVGFSTLEPGNLYQIRNADREVIFKATADTIKRVELRDGFAVIQTTSNNVSLLREDRSMPVKDLFGSELLVSKKLLAAYTPHGLGYVYSLEGKQLFPRAGVATRAVQKILISNRYFAVVDLNTRVLTVYNLSGEEIFTTLDTEQVLLSDGFLVTKSAGGTLSLYQMNGDDSDLLTSDSGMSNIQISDQFAGYMDYYGNLRLFSRSAGEFASMPQVKSFQLTNAFAMVTDAFGLNLYGQDKTLLETPRVRKAFAASHSVFAEQGITGMLTVKNEETEESFSLNRADQFAVSDDLLLVKNGMGEFAVYSLKSGGFGQLLYSVLDHTVAEYQVGNGIVSFRTTLQTGASNSAKVLAFGGGSKTLLVDESPVNKVNLSVNREELNWK